MAIAVNLIPGPMGVSGPDVEGTFGVENYELVGDGAATSVVITARWLRRIDFVKATGLINNIVLDQNARSATLTFTAALPNGNKVYAALYGQSR